MVKVCSNDYPEIDDIQYKDFFDWFPYSLSVFQKYSIQAIIEGHHSLVTAHTGSGKSLPAEFAIQYFKKQGKKVIYTSPIKALSSQKYYEFTQKYPDISFGLITGDIKINPTADVLIMTAEILLNYLFVTQSIKDLSTIKNLQFQIDIDTELACVVMDEIHYINDRDRGSVWEKTILMLPKHIQMIMLSATIDSPESFAKWCERDDIQKQVWLSSTTHRIVPLVHYGFLTTTEMFFKKTKDKALQQLIRDTTNDLITLKTSGGKYMDDGLNILSKTKKILLAHDVLPKRSQVLNQLCSYLKTHEMFPAITFVFSRKNVELYAKEITTNLLEDDSKIPYIVGKECEQIIRKLPNYQEYLHLPEYNTLVSLLEKGVGIHHSGMIPVLREIVELMISKKYIKMLFATESFAIGLNCPIRTAVFTSLTKFDGTSERYLLPHEYNQAASRCGRRGIDTIGHVIHCNNLFEIPSQYEYKNILCGNPQKLSSKLRISMPLVLNLIQKYRNESEVLDFINKSMIREELNKNQQSLQDHIKELEEQVEKSKQNLKYIKTPIEICQEYLILQKTMNTFTQKKRKEADKKIQQLLNDNRTLKEDSIKVDNVMKLEYELTSDREELHNGDTYFASKISNICYLLTKHCFIVLDDNNNYEITKKGKTACSLSELNPIIMSEFLWYSENMYNLNTVQIIQLLSCFTDVKVSQDCRLSVVPNNTDIVLKKSIDNIQNIKTNIYEPYTQEQNITISNNGSENDLDMMFDLIDLIEKWTQCQDEAQCKWFILSELSIKEISIGDFTKAILKISTMSKELMNVAEQHEEMLPLLVKFGEIDNLILKYITTSQSLYV